MKATDLLQRDHRRITELFAELDRARGEASVFARLREELEMHSRIEDEVFYPALVRLPSDDARDAVREALEEHRIFRDLLAELGELRPVEERFAAQLAVLRENIEHHVYLEEREMFVQARRHLRADQLEQLGNAMEDFREQLIAEQSPRLLRNVRNVRVDVRRRYGRTG